MTQPAHGWRSHYALLVLLFVYTMSFIDRQMMDILVQPIKQEFGVSDTAMGLLTGLAFAVFYSALAIPLGRYAGRSNRRNFVAYCCAAWSMMTAFCGVGQVGSGAQPLVRHGNFQSWHHHYGQQLGSAAGGHAERLSGHAIWQRSASLGRMVFAWTVRHYAVKRLVSASAVPRATVSA